MLQAIKIVKNYRNGSDNHIIFIDENATADEIREAVEYWAEYENGSGHNNGYDCKWEAATDKEEILKALEKKIKYVDNEMIGLAKLSVDLGNYQFILNEPK